MAPTRLVAALERSWWQPHRSALGWVLTPLAWMYGLAWRLHRWRHRRHRRPSAALPVPVPVPVIVVGNLVVGGVGKTPVLMALVEWLRGEGYRPGVISRGYGREGDGVMPVTELSRSEHVGDEPMLIRRRCQVPVWVGRDRVAAAQALRAQHPEIDVIVSDDGLQHLALPRTAELIVFDERGAGNGALLPAGPLREPLRAAQPPALRWLINADRPPPALDGARVMRRLAALRPLQAWHRADSTQDAPISALAGRTVVAAAGVGNPQRFFDQLVAAGLTIEPLPLPDHHPFHTLPWPVSASDVVVTEKDAVKIDPQHIGSTRVWVARLDLVLPADVTESLRQLLRPHPPSIHP